MKEHRVEVFLDWHLPTSQQSVLLLRCGAVPVLDHTLGIRLSITTFPFPKLQMCSHPSSHVQVSSIQLGWLMNIPSDIFPKTYAWRTIRNRSPFSALVKRIGTNICPNVFVSPARVVSFSFFAFICGRCSSGMEL